MALILRYRLITPAFLILSLLSVGLVVIAQTSLGDFTSESDVGKPPKAGSATFAGGTYTVSGGGANIWGTADSFHYVWKKVSGDITMSASVKFAGSGTEPHRKAALMIRQSLDPGSAYVDAAVHAEGLTSLQYRPADKAATLEVRAADQSPSFVRLERRGNQFTMYSGTEGKPETETGPVTVHFMDPVYVGLAVSAHNADQIESAEFSSVKLKVSEPDRTRAILSTYDLNRKFAYVLINSPEHIEAPNWSPNGRYLLINAGGDIYTVTMDTTSPFMKRIDLQGVHGCNNDHGISPDGQTLAVSARGPSGQSQVYLASLDGANVRLMTPTAPSYFHSFSPDGKYFAFVGQRNGNFDIYRMPVAGGPEERLTSHAGYDDGPDYSPDGKWIYFNSDRSGSWDIWRMPADGAGANDANAERVTSDEMEDWFPHPSPDGRWIVFVSFAKGTKGHPANQNVSIRRLPMPHDSLGAQPKPETLMTMVGGQGTLNVNSWKPDAQRFAFVRYEKK